MTLRIRSVARSPRVSCCPKLARGANGLTVAPPQKNCKRCDHRLSELDEANLLGFFALLARGNLELNGVTLVE